MKATKMAVLTAAGLLLPVTGAMAQGAPKDSIPPMVPRGNDTLHVRLQQDDPDHVRDLVKQLRRYDDLKGDRIGGRLLVAASKSAAAARVKNETADDSCGGAFGLFLQASCP